MAKLGVFTIPFTSALTILLLLLNDITFVDSNIIKTLPGFLGDLPFKLETGYIGVGENQDAQLFYFFVESERNPEEDPLLFWNNGGPGCSGLGTFLYQLGPLQFDYGKFIGDVPKLDLNPDRLSKVANIIYMDTVGAGFSYGMTAESYKTSDTLSTTLAEEFLRKWLKNHPRHISNPLYVGGVSYAGIIVPALVRNIYIGNELSKEPIINIKGYMLGNPLVDRNIDFNSRIPYANQFALISDELFESTKVNCGGDYINPSPSNNLCSNDLGEVDKCLKDICDGHILEPMCNLETGSRILLQRNGSFPEDNPQNSLQETQECCENAVTRYLIAWANDKTVQKALHVIEETVTEWTNCNTDHYEIGRNDTDTYAYDISSSISFQTSLTKESCRALIYSGDHDMVFPYLGTRKWIHALDLTVESTWAPWFFKNQVAGYKETFSHDTYSLTYATVKGAGHIVPQYKPEECFAMVDRWFANHPL